MSRFNEGPQVGRGAKPAGPPPPGRPGGPPPPPNRFGGSGGGPPGGAGGPGGRSGERPERKVGDLWPDYLKGGYFDPPDPAGGGPVGEAGGEAQGSGAPERPLRLEFVSRERVEPLVREMAHDYPALTSGQLRRFFQHCRAVETRLRSGGADWAGVAAQVTFLDAAAADAYGKSPRKIPSLFYDFIRRNVAAVKSKRDFLAGFLPHFEALVGFGSLHLKERN